ncbi:MAG TPA: efflux RND transporter permease subunit [Phycisphaerales bacterium]|nr:efflux RND transporter permease subunit [Phycisphaerales bacterium]HMP37887.1 efflux RND transporter permease subunit [Phycisphaerales bacterium]
MSRLIPPLARFGVHRPVPVNLLMAALIVAGIYCGATMQREFFPQTDPDRARVVMPFPGATPQEIEESMVRKVEDALAELKEVKKLETTIGEGVGVTIVEFRSGVRVRDGVDEVKDAIDALRDLPPDAEPIRVSKLEPNIPTIMLTLYGDAGEERLKEAIRRIADDLRTLPGMGTIVLSGTRDYEVRVDVSAPALLEHGISLPMIADAIGAWMRDIPGGTVRSQAGNIAIRTLGVPEDVESIRSIVVKASPDGQSLRVGDIASVREYFVDEQVERRFNTKPAVSITVFKTGDQDAIAIAEMVRGYAAGRLGEPPPDSLSDRIALALGRPAGPEGGREPAWRTPRRVGWDLGRRSAEALPGNLALHSDLARLIEGRLALLSRNAAQGAALILLALLLMLNPRTAFWVMVGLFTALCGTLLAMTMLSVTLNLLTMFGLLITLGMLQDDAIVVSENIVARHDRGESPTVAAINGAEEVFWPVFCTVLTTIVAFLPLTFIRGPVGDLLKALPLVVLAALLVSFLETTTIMPAHLAHSLESKARRGSRGVERIADRFCAWRDRAVIARAIDLYGRMVAILLRRRYITTAVALATLLASFGMIAGGRLPFTFLPRNDAETIVVDVRLPIGTPLERTQEVIRRVERAAMEQPELRSISAVVGERANIETALTDAPATHVGQLFIELKVVEERDRESSAVIAAIRQALGPLPEVEELRFKEITGGPAGTDITVEIRGEDRRRASEAAERVRALLASYEGVRDIADDDDDSQPEIHVALRPEAAAHGFTVAGVARQVRGVLFGLDAHVFSDRREDIDVRVRLDEPSRRRVATVEDFWTLSPRGEMIPLSEIAELRDGEGFATIRRIDRQRTISVFADCDHGVNPEQVTAAVLPGLEALQREFPGLTIQTGGRAQDLRDAFASLPIAFAAAMLMIYAILAWLFASYTQPFAVMLAIPFGVIGVVWGHVFMGFQLDFLSLIGFVALAGVVVNNSLVLVQFVNGLVARGLPLHEALVAAGRARLRAIVLTSVTTFLGLVPLMFEQSFQARFLIPMAISIAFGLLSATVLTLIVLPCILVIIDDAKAAAHWCWHGRTRGESAAAEAAAARTEALPEQ